jgi:hypothetical protein
MDVSEHQQTKSPLDAGMTACISVEGHFVSSCVNPPAQCMLSNACTCAFKLSDGCLNELGASQQRADTGLDYDEGMMSYPKATCRFKCLVG